MLPSTHSPQRNQLLAALSEEEYSHTYPSLRLVPMPLGTVLYESGDVLSHVHFPADCIVSLLYVLENGAAAEISVVGNVGLVGIAVFMARRPPLTERSCRARGMPIVSRRRC
jgi:hypothetical protein